MATLIIRAIKDALHIGSQNQATAHCRSLGEKARLLLHQGVAASPTAVPQTFGQAVPPIFRLLGRYQRPEIERAPAGGPPDFDAPQRDPRAGARESSRRVMATNIAALR